MKMILKKYLLGLLTIAITSISFAQSSDYVTLEGDKFMLEGEEFFPLGVNYSVSAKIDFSNQLYIGRAVDYTKPDLEGGPVVAPFYPYYNYNVCQNKDACRLELLQDFQEIRNKGFNALRVVGIAFGESKEGHYPSIKLSNLSYAQESPLSLDPPYTEAFEIIDQLLDVAEEAELRVQLLVGGHEIDSLGESFDPLVNNRTLYVDFLEAIAAEFADNPWLYSYDLMNEPRSEDNYSAYSKGQTCELVAEWNAAIQNNCDQLTTIGLQGSLDTYEWDPEFIKVDFLSHHIYGFGGTNYAEWLENVRREIRWIGQTSRIPWIIGEIGFPASNDPFTDCSTPGACDDPNLINPTVAEQALFVHNTLRTVRDYGGIGYNWWQYCDVHWQPGYGLVERDGSTKPAFDEFAENVFDPFAYEGYDNVSHNSYYRVDPSMNYTKYGTVKDQNGNPIENAIIQHWDDEEYTTFSHSDGTFALHSNSVIWKVKATAPGTDFDKNSSNPYNLTLNKIVPLEFRTVDNITVPISESAPPPVIYEATNTVTAHHMLIDGDGVDDGAYVHLRADKSVKLQEGFKARRGSLVRIYNQRVYYGCSTYLGEDYTKYDALYEWGKSLSPIEPEEEEEILLVVNGIAVSPNPSNGIFTVNAMEDNLTIHRIEVFNSMGNKISEYNETSRNQTIDISSRARGFYILRIHTNEGVAIDRVVIE